jgi:CRISPR-associated protein Cmr3
MKETLGFKAIDTLFFRESRPMEAPGSSELGSIFPPPMRTLAGAIRTSIAESMGVDWNKFKDEHQPEIQEIIGFGDDYGTLSFQGIWLHHGNQRLYPAPLNLIAKRQDSAKKLDDRKKIESIDSLIVNDSVCECDLGDNVRLACIPDNMEGCKSLHNHWLTADGLQKVLSGNEKIIKPKKEIIGIETLRKEEPRLGIARDNEKRTVKDGMLYQTRHLRLNGKTSFYVEVNGHRKNIGSGVVKLGGEGRMATIQSDKREILFPKFPSIEKADKQSCEGIILYLLTPMLLPDDSEFLPGFEKAEINGTTVWKGTLHDISLNLMSSVIGKVQREGGWDMAKHEPKTLKSLVPAGSVFYCKVENGDLNAAMKALHNRQIGDEQYLGRGHIATGLWIKKPTKGKTS